MIDEVEKALYLTDLDIAELYAGLAADRATGEAIFDLIRMEHARTRDYVGLITESSVLAERFPAFRQRTERARPLIDRTNRLQVSHLRTFRGLPEGAPEKERLMVPLIMSMSCIATGLGWTG